jgi:hypothetical protein
MKALLIGSLVSLSLFSALPFADEPASGFALESLPYPAQSLTASMGDGSILTFDGTNVEIFSPDGTPIQILASLGSFAFGSFLKLSPAEDFVVLGESSLGNVYRINTDGSGSNLIGTVNLNYDAVFENANSLILSAATGGFGMDNDILRLDLTSGATTFLASIDGASGPLAIDQQGNLFYGTNSAAFPAPMASSDILRFNAALLTGIVVLDESDASLISSGFDNATALEFDPQHGDLFLAEVNSGLGLNQIRAVGSTPALSPILLIGDAGTFLSNLEFVSGDGQSKMRAFQSGNGGTLFYNNTNFSSVFERNSLAPQRSELSLSGPGTLGLGQVVLDIFGGQPGGSALIFYGPLGQVITPEYAVNLPSIDFPLLFSLNPASVSLLPMTIPLDAFGNGQVVLNNPSGQINVLSVQALHRSTASLKGTSSARFL